MPGPAFFASVRNSLFAGSIPQSAVDAITALDAQWGDSKVNSPDQFAYILATVYHECGAGMLLETESFAYSSARMLQVWPAKFKSLADAQVYVGQPEKLANHVYAGVIGNGNETSGDGWRFRGRAWPQLTGRANYANFSQLIGVDLVANPDAVLDPSVSAKVMVTGMIEGQFTGKKLGDYFTATKQDATHARAIVNGDVMANGPKIAGYWQAFRTALHAVEPKPAVIASPPTISPAPKPQPQETTLNLSILSIILKFLPDISALEQDVAAEVKLIGSSADGMTKINQTIVILEDLLARIKAALAG